MTGTRGRRYYCFVWAFRTRKNTMHVHHWHWPRSGIVSCDAVKRHLEALT